MLFSVCDKISCYENASTLRLPSLASFTEFEFTLSSSVSNMYDLFQNFSTPW